MSIQYKEAYALIISARNMTRAEHDSLQEYINHLSEITNGFTPYESFVDTRYSDDIIPEEE